VAFAGCVCTSSRAAAEVESRRRVLLALGRCRTHRRHALNCHIDGVTGAMAMMAWTKMLATVLRRKSEDAR
jgi:hypothetical protein